MSTLPQRTGLKQKGCSQSGAALIVVLSILVLLTAVMVAFMVSTRDDLNATIQYAAGERVHALSEEAVSLVMGQIREATLSTVDSSDGKGIKAWASQPGALRVWDNNGHFEQLYKLYSAKQMKEDSLDFLDDEIPSDWRSRPDDYTDLNEPVSKSDTSGTTTTWHYPIMNPAAIGVVDGFDSTQHQESDIDYDSRTSMPVHWLYMSKSGKLTNTLQDKKSGDPSVGRIAFWTDDETSKVNINTASANANSPTPYETGSGINGLRNKLGFSFWTPPHSRMMQDYNMGRSNLRQNEFQRYTSHPASVNLLSILKGTSFNSLTELEKLNTLRNIFSLFPRYQWGGSENARYTYGQDSDVDLTNGKPRTDRLYDSVDELLFAPDRSIQALPALTGNLTDAGRADMYRFFLTTSSRAPDLNLFGQPRVSLWPISGLNDSQHRTIQDNLIAFCTTVGSKSKTYEYFFQRLYPFSQTADWEEFPRNKKIFEYLQNLTSSKIPGFGGDFVTKYDKTNGGVAGEMSQILTEIFDYIRVANLNESFMFRPDNFQSYTPDTPIIPKVASEARNYETVLGLLKDSSPPSSAHVWAGRAGAGMVLPILTPYGRGAGRVPVLSEVALMLIQGIKFDRTPDPKNPAKIITTVVKDEDGNSVASNEIQSGVVVETFSPMQGYMPWTPRDFQMTVKTGATLNEMTLFPGADSGVTTAPFNRTTVNNPFQPVGGTDGFMMGTGSWASDNNYPHPYMRPRDNAIPIPNGEPLILTGAALDIDFTMKQLQADGSESSVTPYQTFHLEIPGAELPIPALHAPSTLSNPDSTAIWMDWTDRWIPQVHFRSFPEDVIHSLVPYDGDYRMIAYLQEVPAQFFRKHPEFGTSEHFAHSLRLRREYGLAETTNGSFAGLSYGDRTVNASGSVSDIYNPDIPPDITDLVQKGWEGDWDNGIGNYPDGAYLGKPDEGQFGLRKDTESVVNYFNEYRWSQADGLFSPTLQMPSAMMFGSLPTAVRRTYTAYINDNFSEGRPWRTLLFCPNPDYEISTGGTHYGKATPPDYLLADLFHLPVVEPYAISEPLSTAGRINMNYQILPFTNIKRSTGLVALFGGQKIGALPNSISAKYKSGAPAQNDNTKIYLDIDPIETLKQFEERFNDKKDLFRSAAEICSIFLVPQGVNFSNIKSWWSNYRLTGDNMREKPYATIYPLLTTKSNTYTVHMRVQTLAEGTTTVTGEYRGSSTIERYIDPNDERIGTDYDPDTQSLEPLYRFRVVDTKRFAP